MGASEEAYGVGHLATFTEQPAPTTQRAQLSEIAHHKDGDADHGFSMPVRTEKPGAHDFNPDA
jgi:hypothetical protein